MTIVKTRAITGGVDTHADVHVAAALDSIGGLLGVQEFPATAAGYTSLLGWRDRAHVPVPRGVQVDPVLAEPTAPDFRLGHGECLTLWLPATPLDEALGL